MKHCPMCRGTCELSTCIYKDRCSIVRCSEASSYTTLAHCKVGDQKIVQFICPNNKCLCQKLCSMGLIEGASVNVIGFAPFNGPIMIMVCGSYLALRRDEAIMIETN